MTHEFDGRKYETASSHQKEWGARLISELGLKGTERVLDLGCGDGVLTSQIAELLPHGEAVGIDASAGMIGVAHSREKGNLRFQLMDINDLRFNREFDVVFSNAAMHWVLDHQRVLEKVRSILRADGVVRFQFAGSGNSAHFFKVVRSAMSTEEFSAAFSNFQWPWYMPTVAEYQAIVNAAGLTDSRVWGEDADRYFADQGAMIRWIDQPSIVPFLEHLPPKSRSAFRSHVIERMVLETKQPDGRCFETFRRINLWATN